MIQGMIARRRYWSTLAENKRLVEAGAEQQAARHREALREKERDQQMRERHRDINGATMRVVAALPIQLPSGSAAKCTRVGEEYQARLPACCDRLCLLRRHEIDPARTRVLHFAHSLITVQFA